MTQSRCVKPSIQSGSNFPLGFCCRVMMKEPCIELFCSIPSTKRSFRSLMLSLTESSLRVPWAQTSIMSISCDWIPTKPQRPGYDLDPPFFQSNKKNSNIQPTAVRFGSLGHHAFRRQVFAQLFDKNHSVILCAVWNELLSLSEWE